MVINGRRMKLPWLALLALAHTSFGTCSANGYQHNRNLADRIEAFDANELTCQIGDDNSGGKMVTHDFYFWYAMFVSGNVGFQEMYTLEQRLFSAIEDDLLWCWTEVPTFDESEQGNRELTQNIESKQESRKLLQKRKFTSDSRDLGIIAFTQGGLDLKTSRKFSLP